MDDVSRVIDAGVLIPGPSLSDLDGSGDSSADAAFDRLIGGVLDDGPVEAAVVTPSIGSIRLARAIPTVPQTSRGRRMTSCWIAG